MLFELEDVEFSTPLVGWVAANDCVTGKAFVYRTIDGGRSWRSKAVPEVNCAAGSRLDLSFSDTQHGWMVGVIENASGPFLLQRTFDGGATWARSGSAPLNGAIRAITSRKAWLARSDFASPQRLYLTQDGGRTWRRRVLPPPPGWSGAQLFPDIPTFFGAQGVLPVSLSNGNRSAVAFYGSGDGGRTWKLRSVRPIESSVHVGRDPFVRYVPTSIVSPTVWWIAEGRTQPFAAVTTNAGKSWLASTPPSSQHATPWEISASDARHAWLTTSPRSNPRLYTTSDSGRTWTRLSLPPP